jgi:glutamine synthetase type III
MTTDHAAAPRVTICTIDGQYVRLRNMSAEDVMQLLDAFRDPDYEVLSVDLDNGQTQCHVLRVSVARIDVDWELTTGWHRFTHWALSKLSRWL